LCTSAQPSEHGQRYRGSPAEHSAAWRRCFAEQYGSPYDERLLAYVLERHAPQQRRVPTLWRVTSAGARSCGLTRSSAARGAQRADARAEHAQGPLPRRALLRARRARRRGRRAGRRDARRADLPDRCACRAAPRGAPCHARERRGDPAAQRWSLRRNGTGLTAQRNGRPAWGTSDGRAEDAPAGTAPACGARLARAGRPSSAPPGGAELLRPGASRSRGRRSGAAAGAHRLRGAQAGRWVGVTRRCSPAQAHYDPSVLTVNLHLSPAAHGGCLPRENGLRVLAPDGAARVHPTPQGSAVRPGPAPRRPGAHASADDARVGVPRSSHGRSIRCGGGQRNGQVFPRRCSSGRIPTRARRRACTWATPSPAAPASCSSPSGRRAPPRPEAGLKRPALAAAVPRASAAVTEVEEAGDVTDRAAPRVQRPRSDAGLAGPHQPRAAPGPGHGAPPAGRGGARRAAGAAPDGSNAPMFISILFF
jgi:hypothetical protein